MSLIIAMGELMMYGAVAGGAAGALISSTKGVNDACEQLKDVQNKFTTTKGEWDKLIKNEEIDKLQATSWINNMNSTRSQLNTATINYHNMYTKRQYTLIVSIIAFLFLMITLLFFKKINLVGKIKSLF
jgi:predicted PurR-regulated permease PerM